MQAHARIRHLKDPGREELLRRKVANVHKSARLTNASNKARCKVDQMKSKAVLDVALEYTCLYIFLVSLRRLQPCCSSPVLIYGIEVDTLEPAIEAIARASLLSVFVARISNDCQHYANDHA